jgi:toxin ParE1/3/4
LLPVIWLASAKDDLKNILRFIANENPHAARNMKRLIEESVLPIAEHPYIYRHSSRVPGLREIVAHPNYLVLYHVKETCIEVVTVVHARREFPAS